MNEREIVEAIAGFNNQTTADEMGAIFKAARELCNLDPDYSEWVGALVEVRNLDDREWVAEVLTDYREKDSPFPFRVYDDMGWRQCRPYSRPLKLIFTPHRPGDPRPVDGNETVIVKRRDGTVMMRDKAGTLDWGTHPHAPTIDIVGYVRIAL